MEHTLYIVGIGPGHPDYVVPRGLRLMREAKVLIGSERALEDFAQPGQETYVVTGKLTELADFIEEKLKASDVTVTVSGDPGYYSLLTYLKKRFPDTPIDVTAGLSSITFAFARLGETWQNASLLSFHGRVPEPELLRYEQGRRLAFLTEPKYNPAYIAAELQRYGWPADTKAAACERLSYEDERIVKGTLAELESLAGFGHSVLVVTG